MAWTRAVHLDTWSNEQEARHTLPLLIRRLALRTLRSIQKLEFSADEQVGRSGFDGIIETDEGNRFVPKGNSIWEMGVGNNPKRKANEDYEKRTRETPEDERKKTHFVFVTSRNWEAKGDWVDEKLEKPEWASVSALDANDLEHWLEIAPDVDVWLSHLMGRVPEGVEGLEAYWKKVRAIAEFNLLPSVFTASHDDEIRAVRKWLSEPPNSLFLQTTGLTDGLDFLAAFAEQDEQQLLKSALVVDSREAWQRLAGSQESLILINSPALQLNSTDTAGAVENGHFVLVCGPRGIVGSERSLKLNRQDHYEVYKALNASGFSEPRARSLAKACCGSTSILKRLITKHPETTFPDWAKNEERPKLAALALAGGWADVNQKPPAPGDEEKPRIGSAPPQDISIVTQLVGCTKEELDNLVNRWQQGPEPLFIRFRNQVLVASREDAWHLLAGAISKNQLDRFRDLAVVVLSEDNPKFELEADKQWMANVYGKAHTLSNDLRDSIVETLALMTTYGTADESAVTKEFSSVVEHVLQQVLPPNATWQRWASLGSNLMIIAEADPEFLLGRIEDDLKLEAPVLVELFHQRGSQFFGSSNHTNLLWALESMAWSPEFLTRVAVILAKLAAHVANIKTNANRPEASLTEIFLRWLWHTNASIDQRIEALRAIFKVEPQVGLKLLKEILPGSLKTTSMNTHLPRWRPWAEGWSRRKVNAEWHQYEMALAAFTIEVVGQDPKKWARILDNILCFNADVTSTVISKLDALSQEQSEDDKSFFELWRKLRDIVAKHEQYEDEDWAFDVEVRQQLAKIRDKFAPSDPVLRNQWLFDVHVRLAKFDVLPYEAHNKALTDARTTAIREIVSHGGAEDVFRLLDLAPAASAVGWIVGAEKLLTPSDIRLPSILNSEKQSDLGFVEGYIQSRFNSEKWAFIDSLGVDAWTNKQVSILARCLPFSPEVWKWVENRGSGVKTEYWRTVRGFLYQPTLESVRIACESLIEASRPFEAIDHLNTAVSQKVEVPSEFIAFVLESALSIKDIDLAGSRRSLSYEIQQLIGVLQKDEHFNRLQLARFEWGFLPALDRHSSSIRPDTLINAVGDNSSMFVDLLKLMFRGKGDAPDANPLSDEDRHRAEYAFNLIDELDRLPGTDAGGGVNYEHLEKWINESRRLAEESGRLSVCDSTIGKIIARSTEETDGAIPKPSTELAAIFERVATEDMIDGFVIGTMNQRGVTWRNPLDGGKPERELAAKCREISKSFHSVSKKLSDAYVSLARSYEASAKVEDEDAAREKLDR